MTKEEQQFRDNHINTCVINFKEQMKGMNISDEVIKEFCACNTDTLMAKFSIEEIDEMDELLANGNEQQKAAIDQKLVPILKPCIDKFQNKFIS